jgi:hypothetical protein
MSDHSRRLHVEDRLHERLRLGRDNGRKRRRHQRMRVRNQIRASVAGNAARRQ